MHKLFYLVAFITAFALVGCGEQRIDGSSDESMQASVDKMLEGLSAEEQEAFKEAVLVVALDGKNILDAATSGNAETVAAGFKAKLDGMTRSDVMAKADQLTKERHERERAQALAEIKELEAKVQAAEAAKADLAKFQVVRSRFYQREEKYSFRKKPIIELTVKNGTEHAISRVYFEGTVASPGRSVPWIKDTFNYQIAGGLEPGEEVSWSLAPNQFSDWGKTVVPADAVLTLVTYKIDGANGETLYSAEGLSERALKRLATLKAKYPE